MTNRNQLIDSLRGFAILVMILTHATAYFPSDKISYWLWDWSHFAVPIFIFCSTYLFLQKSDISLDSLRQLADRGNDKGGLSFKNYFAYLKKRVFRLVIPYYIFLGFFLVTLFFIDPQKITTQYVTQSIFLIGGVDINWLVLLFLYITIILPLFVWSYTKAKIIFWIYFVLSISSVFWFLLHQSPISYKFVMWLPWSIMLYFTMFYLRYEHKKKMLIWLLSASGLVFIGAYFLRGSLDQSTVLIHNKYPPNILYLSYGVSLLLLLSLLQNYLFKNAIVLKVLHFFSKFSYSIYFIHYLVLIIFAYFIKEWQLNWLVLTVLVLTTTILLQKLYNWIRMKVAV